MALRPRYFDNARLAIDLALLHGAKGTDAGRMSNFSATPPDWVCPGCSRAKAEIARLDRHGNFYCALHLHHDHLYDGLVARMLGANYQEICAELSAKIQGILRFQDVYVCMDCNRADGSAKKMIKAPEYFSFSPSEIARFIIVQPNAGHEILRDIPAAVYADASDEFLAKLKQGALDA